MNQPVGPGSGGDGIHTLKALALIVVVVVIGWAVLHHTTKPAHGSSASASPTTTAPRSSPTTVPGTSTPTTTVALIPPNSIKLQVLNGVGSGNLATQWSTKLRANPGYNTLAPDNATATVTRSTIFIVTPGYQREAESLAVTCGLTSGNIVPTIPPPAGAPITTAARTNANLVLVIGPDLAGTA